MDKMKETTADEWEEVFNIIVPLYLKHELLELREVMEKQGFRASVDSYKKKLSEWQRKGRIPPKHLKKTIKGFIAQKSFRRRQEQGKDTEFRHNTVQDWVIEAEQAKGYEECHQPDPNVRSPSLEPPKWMTYNTPPTVGSSLGDLCVLWESNTSDTVMASSSKQAASMMSDVLPASRPKEKRERIAPQAEATEGTDESLIEIFEGLEMSQSNCPDWNMFYLAHHLEKAFRLLHENRYRETDLIAFCSRQPKVLADVLAAGVTYDKPSSVVVTDALIFVLHQDIEDDRNEHRKDEEVYGVLMDDHKSRAWDMLIAMMPIQESENPSDESDMHFNQPVRAQLHLVKLLVSILAEMAHDRGLEETVENRKALAFIYHILDRELIRQKDESNEDERTQRILEEELYGHSGQPIAGSASSTASNQPASSVPNSTPPSIQRPHLHPPPVSPPTWRPVSPWWNDGVPHLVSWCQCGAGPCHAAHTVACVERNCNHVFCPQCLRISLKY